MGRPKSPKPTDISKVTVELYEKEYTSREYSTQAHRVTARAAFSYRINNPPLSYLSHSLCVCVCVCMEACE